MVRQVRKYIMFFVFVLVLISATCGTAQAVTHDVYDNGNLSTTYITYFKDILSGTSFKDNYCAFRSGQYEYTMVVGELQYNNGEISLNGEGKLYKFYNDGNYNSTYNYSVTTTNNFSINSGTSIIYSDVGDFPQLIERGAKYEMLNTILLCVALLSVVIHRIFYKR